MAQKCVVCGSPDTGAMLDTYVCHTCGAVSSYQGDVVSPPSNETVVAGPAMVTVSPADTSDPDNPTRVVKNKPVGAGDEFVSTETIGAGAVHVAPQAVEGGDAQ